MLLKLKSFWRALSSWARYGEASLLAHRHRQGQCLGQDLKTPCEELVETKTGLFCRACGCPQWRLSDLRTKWRMPDIECPLKKW